LPSGNRLSQRLLLHRSAPWGLNLHKSAQTWLRLQSAARQSQIAIVVNTASAMMMVLKISPSITDAGFRKYLWLLPYLITEHSRSDKFVSPIVMLLRMVRILVTMKILSRSAVALMILRLRCGYWIPQSSHAQ
jgi:hypothetical protein